MERRLAAILATDVVGYSRLMEADEVGAFAALQAHRLELIDPLIASHKGRLVKLMGDGALVEFASVVDAVSCAVELQQGMAERNATFPEGERIEFRAGVHVGDVMVDGNDLYGDGVNIAARLESLSEIGGVCISRQAFDQVENKLDLACTDIGEQKVKNISRPVRAYQVAPVRAAIERQPSRRRSRRRAALVALATAIAAVLLVGALALWRPWSPPVATASVESMAYPLPEKPSIAVLPFSNISGDPAQEHFTDGITEDLITDLSRVAGLFVIARNSTFVYKNQQVSVPAVAEKLGVRYVLEGSVRRDGAKLRVNAQLIDATTGGHVWAERFDGVATDIFAVQDMFVREIVAALSVTLSPEDEAKLKSGETQNLSARELFQSGWDKYLRYTPEDNSAAVDTLTKALEIDPDYGRAYAALGMAYLRGCQMRWNQPLGMSVDRANALALANLNKARQRPSSLSNVAASRINLYNAMYDEALTDATRAISSDPSDPEAYIAMAWAMITTGNPKSGLEFAAIATRLNPNYPSYYALAVAMAHFSLNDFKKAAGALSDALKRDPGARELAPALAASYIRLGRRADARAAIEQWKPGVSARELAIAVRDYHFPYQWSGDSGVVERLVDGIHVAALPLETSAADIGAQLRSESTRDRIDAAKFLARFGPLAADATPHLIDALSDPSKPVRREAAIALGKIGPAAAAAVPALTAILDQPIVGYHAKAALARIAGE